MHRTCLSFADSDSYFIYPQMHFILWMDKILHHLETMGNHCLLGIYRGIILPGSLRWCRISSIHSRFGEDPNTRGLYNNPLGYWFGGSGNPDLPFQTAPIAPKSPPVRRRGGISAAIYGRDCPLPTFIYPGFDCQHKNTMGLTVLTLPWATFPVCGKYQMFLVVL